MQVQHVLFGHPDRIAGTIYGTVVAMATIVAAASSEVGPQRLAAIVAVTLTVLWVAHLYSHAIGEGVARGRQLTRAEVAEVATRGLALLLAAVPPVAALLLGGLGVFREATAVWLALALGMVTLAGQGVRYAHSEHLPIGKAALAVLLNLALGLLVIALKVAIAH
jgi:hypothetical protein